MLNQILTLDFQITRFINQLLPHNHFFDLFFSFFSLAGSSLFVWVLVIIFVVVIEEIFHPGIQKRDIKFMLYFLISFFVTVLLTDIVIKHVMFRPRPFMTLHLLLANCPRDSSFPSSHAATAFASALVLSAFDKKRKWFYYFVAILVSLSRIYLQCHYVIDVFAGAIIGALISKSILQLHFHLSRNKKYSH